MTRAFRAGPPARAPLLALLIVGWLLAPARGGERVSVAAKDQPLREVLARLSRDSGHAVALDPRVEARLTLTLRDVSWRDALALIAERTRCEVQVLPGGSLYLTRPPRVSVQLSGANIQTALLLLARLGGRSIVIGPDVRGEVTLELRDVSWARALHAVAATHGFAVADGEELVTVGQPRGAAAPQGGAQVLAGAFRALDPEGLRLALDGGEECVVELPPEGGRARQRLQPALERLRPGDRVALSLSSREGRLVLADLAVETRSGGD